MPTRSTKKTIHKTPGKNWGQIPINLGATHYIYLPTASGPMPIAAILNGRKYAMHTDHLNTPRRLSQANGRAVWQWAYSAFGEEQPTKGSDRFVNPQVMPNAGSTNLVEVNFNLRYPGQYFDRESGLSYNYYRSYDARTGRYSQADPIGLQGGWNRHSYVGGNPISNVDPMGLSLASLVSDATGGCSSNSFADDVVNNFVDVQDQTSLAKTGMSLALGGTFAKQYGGLTALGAAADVLRDSRAGFAITGVGSRTFLQAAATGAATWVINGVLIKGSFDACVLAGSVLRMAINHAASAGHAHARSERHGRPARRIAGLG